MRMFRSILFAALMLLAGVHTISAQSAQEKKDQKEREIKELLESDFYTIDVNRALPLNGSPVNLTSSYTLEMRGDSAISHLPYFGRAYSIPYGGGDGLCFTRITTNRSITFDDKGTADIEFEAKTNEDNFTYHIKAFSNGSATIFVQPANRQSISFHGELNTTKKVKEGF